MVGKSLPVGTLRRVAGLRTAVIPAAGRGARLDRGGTPKPLVEIGGVPMIVRLVGQLADVGVHEIVVIVGHGGAAIARALAEHPRLAIRPRIVEAAAWADGLAGTLEAARPWVHEPFVLAMADHVFDPRLVARIATSVPAPGEIVAAIDREPEGVFALPDAVKVALDGDRVAAIGALGRYDGVDAGLFAATPALFDQLAAARTANRAATLADAIAIAAGAGRVRAMWTDGLAWDDVDTPAAAVHAELRVRREQRHAVGAVEAPPRQLYQFHTGTPATTEVIVRRGAGTDPTGAELGIPADSGSSPIFVITDETVNRLYGDRFLAGLARGGYDVHRVVMPDGEGAKSLDNFGWLVETVLARGIDEHSVIVSLGGGVVCNVAGFVAATLYRGIGLCHVPTTLMAQCDAAISHKQALNGARGKNLIGAYYAPHRIVVDVDFLPTLPLRLLRDGLAEALKHALAQDASYLDWFMAQGRELRDPAFLEHVVRRNIELKCELMADDPKEHAQGMVLQYAHNVAHAIEYLSSYELTHGESVAIGMMVAARVARLMGGATDALVAVHDRLLAKYDLPRAIPAAIRTADVIAAMRYDKKTLVEGVRMALLRDAGVLWRVDGEYAIPVPLQVLEQALDQSREG